MTELNDSALTAYMERLGAAQHALIIWEAVGKDLEWVRLAQRRARRDYALAQLRADIAAMTGVDSHDMGKQVACCRDYWATTNSLERQVALDHETAGRDAAAELQRAEEAERALRQSEVAELRDPAMFELWEASLQGTGDSPNAALLALQRARTS